MPRYVILEHDWPQLHWDLLLEQGSVLKAWRILHPIVLNSPLRIEQNFDHRLMYLDFEGPLSNQRGSVHRWDSGDYQGDIQISEEGVCQFQLNGLILRGTCRIWNQHGEWWMQIQSG